MFATAITNTKPRPCRLSFRFELIYSSQNLKSSREHDVSDPAPRQTASNRSTAQPPELACSKLNFSTTTTKPNTDTPMSMRSYYSSEPDTIFSTMGTLATDSGYTTRIHVDLGPEALAGYYCRHPESRGTVL